MIFEAEIRNGKNRTKSTALSTGISNEKDLEIDIFSITFCIQQDLRCSLLVTLRSSSH